MTDAAQGKGGGRPTTKLPDRSPEVSLPGKKAVAEAAGMDPAQLRRLRPVVDASEEEVEAAALARVGARRVAR